MKFIVDFQRWDTGHSQSPSNILYFYKRVILPSGKFKVQELKQVQSLRNKHLHCPFSVMSHLSSSSHTAAACSCISKRPCGRSNLGPWTETYKRQLQQCRAVHWAYFLLGPNQNHKWNVDNTWRSLLVEHKCFHSYQPRNSDSHASWWKLNSPGEMTACFL